MDKEASNGLMEQNMRVIGLKIKQTVKANFGMQTETSTKVNGRTTKLMDTESMCMLTVPAMKVTGKMICKTDGESKAGLMVQNMKENIRKV